MGGVVDDDGDPEFEDEASKAAEDDAFVYALRDVVRQNRCVPFYYSAMLKPS